MQCGWPPAGLAYGAAAASPNMDIANTVLFTYPTALLFASGYLLRWADIPRYWIWCALVFWGFARAAAIPGRFARPANCSSCCLPVRPNLHAAGKAPHRTRMLIMRPGGTCMPALVQAACAAWPAKVSWVG